jgi:transmembrane sensor
MTLPIQTEIPISEQAARWVVRLERCEPEIQAEFGHWLRQSPQHIREFLMLVAIDKAFDVIDLSDINVNELPSHPSGNVVPLETRESGSDGDSDMISKPVLGFAPGAQPVATVPRNNARWIMSVAAALAGIVLVGGWLFMGGTTVDYATAIGEQRTFTLSDETVVQLDPLSHLRVNYSVRRRDVTLLQGDAVFKVRHRPEQPFFVHVGDALIADTGTEFRVDRRLTGTVVSVIQGSVDITIENAGGAPILPTTNLGTQTPPIVGATRISAGEQAKIPSNGKAVRRTTLDSGQIASLDHRRLLFTDDSLGDIAEDFNRYNRSPQIHIQSESLGNLRFSGSFDADDPTSLIEYLRQNPAIAVRRTANEWIIGDAHH